MKTTKAKVLARLIRCGSNPQKAKEQVNNHFNDAVRLYPDATIKIIADAILSFALYN